MKANDWLAQAQAKLEQADIATARLDALILLEDILQRDRAYLLAHPELTLTSKQVATLSKQLKRRAEHEPLSYIRGKTEFYGREFLIDGHVLEPRPESETMIDLLKQLDINNAHIADIGTGSGALAITAQLEIPDAQVAAVDIDEQCLKVTAKNAENHEVKILLFPGDLLAPFLQKSCNFIPDILLCNLPYVPDDFQINQAATHEPAIALFGGPDGLDLYRTLFKQSQELLKQPKVLTESLPSQHTELTAIASAHGYKQVVEDDFIQLFDPLN
jgi:release factor glutamine methyltransferase